jgi:membrane associated rhomboid family serine protease
VIPLRDDNPARNTPWVTYAILAANIAVFIYQLQVRITGGEEAYVDLVYRLGVIPAQLLSPSTWSSVPLPEPLTLLTSMFVHGDLFHLGGNMLYLWVFADNVEDAMGSVRFVLFYALAGLSAAGLQIALMPDSAIPMVGASGAIAGVLGAYLILYPGARVLTFVFLLIFIRIMYLPAALLLGVWFLMQVWSAGGGDGAGVAWFAHIGGFVAGALLIRVFTLGRRRDLPVLRPL